MKGRKPVPNSVKRKASGGDYYNHTPIGNEPKPEAGKLDPPNELSAEEKQAWRAVVSEMMSTGIYTVADRSILTLFCQTWVKNQKAHAVMEKLSFSDKEHAQAFKVFNDTSKSLMRLFSELGLSPTARSRINLPPKIEENDELRAQLEKR